MSGRSPRQSAAAPAAAHVRPSFSAKKTAVDRSVLKSPGRISATVTKRPGYSFEASFRYAPASSAAAASCKSRSFVRTFSALRTSPSGIALAARGVAAYASRPAHMSARSRVAHNAAPGEAWTDAGRRELTRMPLSGDIFKPPADHFAGRLADAREVCARQAKEGDTVVRCSAAARRLAQVVCDSDIDGHRQISP